MNIGPKRTYDGKRPFLDQVEVEFQAPSKDNSIGSPPEASIGTPSLFNPYAMVVFPSIGIVAGANDFAKIFDGGAPVTGAAGGNTFSPDFKQSVPSISMLVEDPSNVLSNKTPYN